MSKTNFRITNITCGACVKLSEMALKKIPGVKSVEIGGDGSVMVESDKEISETEIKNTLAKVDKNAVFN